MTVLLTWGSPASIAAAGHLKLLPWLAAGYWVVRRDVRAAARVVGWALALLLVQALIEPGATLDFLRLSWQRPDVRVEWAACRPRAFAASPCRHVVDAWLAGSSS